MSKHRKDWKALFARLRRLGWQVHRTRRRVQLRGPKGQLVHCAATPSDWRGLPNTVARLRRAGADV